MLTLKLITEETERVIKGLEKKHFNGAREAIENVIGIDKKRKEAQQKLDKNKQEANTISKQVGLLMKEGKKEEQSFYSSGEEFEKARSSILEKIKKGK